MLEENTISIILIITMEVNRKLKRVKKLGKLNLQNPQRKN